MARNKWKGTCLQGSPVPTPFRFGNVHYDFNRQIFIQTFLFLSKYSCKNFLDKVLVKSDLKA